MKFDSHDAAKTRPTTATPLVVGAVLLAAGAGSRLGNRPKSLLELDGVPLIARLLAALSTANVHDVVVVLGHHADAIEKAIRGTAATLIRNPKPDEGQAVSLRLGLSALGREHHAVIVALADQPLINAQDINDLIHAFVHRADAQLVVPRVSGKPGNPVIIDALLRDEWLAGDVDDTGRRWREHNAARVLWFDSPNVNYRVDIDSEEDRTRFRENTGRPLQWPT